LFQFGTLGADLLETGGYNDRRFRADAHDIFHNRRNYFCGNNDYDEIGDFAYVGKR